MGSVDTNPPALYLAAETLEHSRVAALDCQRTHHGPCAEDGPSAVSLNFPDLGVLLTTGTDESLCSALDTWRCLCGRQIDPRDLLQHLWNPNAKHNHRGSLFYEYLSFLRQQTCSACASRPTAAQCPVLLQLSALLAIMVTEYNHVSEMWGALNQWMKMEVDSEEPQGVKRQRSTTSNGGKGQGRGKGRKDTGKIQAKKEDSRQDQSSLTQALSKRVLRREDTL